MPSSLNLGSNPRQTIDACRRLADDLEYLIAHGRPADAALLNAPLLDQWRHVLAPSAALAGIVDGHPLLRDGRPAVTSNLFAIAPAAGFARTWNRWYRLGRPASLSARLDDQIGGSLR